MEFRKLSDLQLKDKKVLLRLDLNVPLDGGKITDDTRIQAALPTIRYLLEHTKKIAIMSHLGRPDGEVMPEYSLEPVGERLAELLNLEVVFVKDYTNEPAEHVINQLSKNQIVLYENLRFHAGETKNDPNFARQLAQGFDFYVNDAFGTLHRAHASVVAAAEFFPANKRAAGLLVEREIEVLSALQKKPTAPFTVIMGGSKVSDKISVVLNLMQSANYLLVGGAMAYTFLKYKGVDVGDSRVEHDKLDLVASIYKNAEARKVEIVLPEDHIAAERFAKDAQAVELNTKTIPKGLMGLDIGRKTAKRYADIIALSKTVLWNGPMGVFEFDQFARGSLRIAEAMADCNGFTVIGGGDSVSAANKAKVANRIDHISTGGGASLEFLEGTMLPGVKVLLK
ncbi:MAG: phosphoglycerate kinase [Proteobacteria bacterium]|nr:MAG: phosphoglycerate kinase [Pseudomonadota bacterium]